MRLGVVYPANIGEREQEADDVHMMYVKVAVF
jgi:hypothetical protein